MVALTQPYRIPRMTDTTDVRLWSFDRRDARQVAAFLAAFLAAAIAVHLRYGPML